MPSITSRSINLVNEITNIFITLSHPSPSTWTNNEIIKSAFVAATREQQRFLINRYWRMQLGMCQENSTNERFCLFDDDTDRAYLKIFKEHVAPFIVRNNLT